MGSFKTALIIVMIMLASLFYVHSQVETTKLGYLVKKNQKRISTLIDENRVLMYNVTSLRSPALLGKNLTAKKADYYMPKQTIIVKANSSKPKDVMFAKSTNFRKGFLAIFEPKREAQAEER